MDTLDNHILEKITYYGYVVEQKQILEQMCLVLNNLKNEQLCNSIHRYVFKQSVTVKILQQAIDMFPRSKWLVMIAYAMKIPYGCILNVNFEKLMQLQQMAAHVYKHKRKIDNTKNSCYYK